MNSCYAVPDEEKVPAMADDGQQCECFRLTILTVFLATNLVASAQSKLPEAPYESITPRQSLQWFVSSTVGPQHLAVGVFSSAQGPALDRPRE